VTNKLGKEIIAVGYSANHVRTSDAYLAELSAAQPNCAARRRAFLGPTEVM